MVSFYQWCTLNRHFSLVFVLIWCLIKTELCIYLIFYLIYLQYMSFVFHKTGSGVFMLKIHILVQSIQVHTV